MHLHQYSKGNRLIVFGGNYRMTVSGRSDFPVYHNFPEVVPRTRNKQSGNIGRCAAGHDQGAKYNI